MILYIAFLLNAPRWPMNILNTGIRESELCSLEMDDITISDRKGTIIIRSGKGNKYRELPLNEDARNALADYIFFFGRVNVIFCSQFHATVSGKFRDGFQINVWILSHCSKALMPEHMRIHILSK